MEIYKTIKHLSGKNLIMFSKIFFMQPNQLLKKSRKKRILKNILFKYLKLLLLPHKKIGPSVETERPLRLLDMRLFRCIICKAGNLLKNILPAFIFYSRANLNCKTVTQNSIYFLFYHARTGVRFYNPLSACFSR